MVKRGAVWIVEVRLKGGSWERQPRVGVYCLGDVYDRKRDALAACATERRLSSPLGEEYRVVKYVREESKP